MRNAFLLLFLIQFSTFAQSFDLIPLGTSANDGTGLSLRAAFQLINSNFATFQGATLGKISTNSFNTNQFGTDSLTNKTILSGATMTNLVLRGGATRVKATSASVEQNLEDHLAEDYDFSAFGAVMDGLSDSLTAVQLAVNTVSNRGGGRIHVSGGMIAISGTVTLPSRIEIAGVGPGVGFRQLAEEAPIFYNGGEITLVKLENLTLEGHGDFNATNQTGQDIGLSLSNAASTSSRVILRDVTCTNFGWSGIKLSGINDVLIDGFHAAGTGDAVYGDENQFGIYFNNVGFLSLRDVWIHETATGIFIGNAANSVVLNGVHIWDALGQHGIYGSGTAGATVSQLVISNTAWSGLKWQIQQTSPGDATALTISDGVFQAIGEHGINVLRNSLATNGFLWRDVLINNVIIEGTNSITPASGTTNGLSISLNNINGARVSNFIVRNRYLGVDAWMSTNITVSHGTLTDIERYAISTRDAAVNWEDIRLVRPVAFGGNLPFAVYQEGDTDVRYRRVVLEEAGAGLSYAYFGDANVSGNHVFFDNCDFGTSPLFFNVTGGLTNIGGFNLTRSGPITGFTTNGVPGQMPRFYSATNAPGAFISDAMGYGDWVFDLAPDVAVGRVKHPSLGLVEFGLINNPEMLSWNDTYRTIGIGAAAIEDARFALEVRRDTNNVLIGRIKNVSTSSAAVAEWQAQSDGAGGQFAAWGSNFTGTDRRDKVGIELNTDATAALVYAPNSGQTFDIYAGAAALSGQWTINGLTVPSSRYITLANESASRALFLDASKRITGSGASADLAAALTDETGTGAAVFAEDPAFTGTVTLNGTNLDTLIAGASSELTESGTGDTTDGSTPLLIDFGLNSASAATFEVTVIGYYHSGSTYQSTGLKSRGTYVWNGSSLSGLVNGEVGDSFTNGTLTPAGITVAGISGTQGLRVSITGEAGKTISWKASVRYTSL